MKDNRIEVQCESMNLTKRLGAYLLVTAVALCYGPSVALAAPILGSAQNFAVLGATTVTSTGPTTINGNLGVSPGTAFTNTAGFTINGTVQLANAVSEQARTDLTTAYNTISALTPTSDLTGQVLGSAGLLSLTPGVYRYSSSAQLTGGLTLNAMGDPNALFVFLIGSTLTTASNSSVQVINGGANNGVYWQVGSSATLGTGTSFAGNILALTSITMDTGTNILCGRGLAINGAVTLDQNIVSGNCASGGDFGSGRTDFASSGFAGGFAPANVEAGGTDTGIPEPGTAAMLSLGFLVTFFVRRSQKRGVR